MSAVPSASASSSTAVKADDEDSKADLNIVLIGDSVLDDFYWLEDEKQDVRQQLEDTMSAKKQSGRVWNFAVDESTSEAVLKGTIPASPYVFKRRDLGLPKYPVEFKGVDKGKVMPLKLIERMFAIGSSETSPTPMASKSKKKKKKTYVICSVGGNDYRELIQTADDASELMLEMQSLLLSLEMNVRCIVTSLQAMGCVPVLVLCYEPHSQWLAHSLPRHIMLTIMDWGVQKLLAMAEEFTLAVVDLARTFDPFNRKHYGDTEIEPSNESGQFIADLILAVVNDGEAAAGHMFALRNAGKSDAEVVKTKIDSDSKQQLTADLFKRSHLETDDLDFAALLVGMPDADERERLLSLSFFDEPTHDA